MGEYKTTGVYIKEQNALGSLVVEAETAIPVFIGLTEKATDGTESMLNRPVKVTSMAEYEKYFGKAKACRFNVTMTDKEDKNIISVRAGGKVMQAKPEGTICKLYYHMVMFFANGGGTCYVVSTGDYNTGSIDKNTIVNTVLPTLKKVQDITLLVIPEAINDKDNYGDIYTAMLAHCAENSRFAILDVPNDKDVESFRTKVGNNNLGYGAAYYPWLVTSILTENDINGEIMIVDETVKSGITELDNFITEAFKTANGDEEKMKQAHKDVHNAMMGYYAEYRLLIRKVKDFMNLLPPSATMAGIYTMVDHSRGVWKAPANVSISRVDKPTMIISDSCQENLNMPMNGKAINALRAFPGDGLKVWGARTMDGNSQDWRYVNVRRTMNFLEISIKNAARIYVSESNEANTWIKMKGMIENFLNSVWKRGGLAGAIPEEAFEVHVGLGDTMTADDIQEGIMRIKVLVAISRPAEFIEITFQLQMQKS